MATIFCANWGHPPGPVKVAVAKKASTDADSRWLADQLMFGSPRYLAKLVCYGNVELPDPFFVPSERIERGSGLESRRLVPFFAICDLVYRGCFSNIPDRAD